MNDVLQTASHIGIIPVIAIEDANNAVPLARALTAGGPPKSLSAPPPGRSPSAGWPGSARRCWWAPGLC